MCVCVRVRVCVCVRACVRVCVRASVMSVYACNNIIYFAADSQLIVTMQFQPYNLNMTTPFQCCLFCHHHHSYSHLITNTILLC